MGDHRLSRLLIKGGHGPTKYIVARPSFDHSSHAPQLRSCIDKRQGMHERYIHAGIMQLIHNVIPIQY